MSRCMILFSVGNAFTRQGLHPRMGNVDNSATWEFISSGIINMYPQWDDQLPDEHD